MQCALPSKMELFILVTITLKEAVITDCKRELGQVYWGIWGSSALKLTPAGTASTHATGEKERKYFHPLQIMARAA